MAKKAKKTRKKTQPKKKVAVKKKSPAKKKVKAKKVPEEQTLVEYMDMSRSELEGHLNLEERRFCILYTSDREFFANGTMSYASAYDFDLTAKGAYNVCGACACALLKKPKIIAYQSKLLELGGLNDVFVDKELAKVVIQDMDFGHKIRAINEYNKLKGRHTKNVNLDIKGKLQVEPVMFGTPIK